MGSFATEQQSTLFFSGNGIVTASPQIHRFAYEIYARKIAYSVHQTAGGLSRNVLAPVQNRLDIPAQRQIHDTACGPACLAMVLQYFNKNIRQEELDAVIQSQGVGTPNSTMITVAREHYVYAVQMNQLSFQAVCAQIDAHRPIVAVIDAGRRYQYHAFHYVLIKGYRLKDYHKQQLLISDPWMGTEFYEDLNVFLRDSWGYLHDANQPTGEHCSALIFSTTPDFLL